MPLINEIKPQTKIKGRYLCKYKQILKNKSDKEYVTLRLQDKSGTADAKIWDINKYIDDFEVFDIVEIEAEALMYQNTLQLKIVQLKKVEEKCDLSDFMPQTKRDVNDLETRFFGYIDKIQDKYLKQLLENIYLKQGVFDEFKLHAASKSVHHSYLNGLLEHTICTTRIGEMIANVYEGVNVDLVIVGCMLHDIGKLVELTALPTSDYSAEGQLLGHIIIGAQLVHDEIKKIEGFPKETALVLEHIILSHHGEYEYGSPKRPKCMEAMAVHLADYTDSRMKILEEAMDNLEPGESTYNKFLDRTIRRLGY